MTSVGLVTCRLHGQVENCFAFSRLFLSLTSVGLVTRLLLSPWPGRKQFCIFAPFCVCVSRIGLVTRQLPSPLLGRKLFCIFAPFLSLTSAGLVTRQLNFPGPGIANWTFSPIRWQLLSTWPIENCPGIFVEQSMGPINRAGIGLSYRPARPHRLPEINSLESITGLLKSLKIPLLKIFSPLFWMKKRYKVSAIPFLLYNKVKNSIFLSGFIRTLSISCRY